MRLSASALIAASLALLLAACSDEALTGTDDPGTPVAFSTLPAEHETLVHSEHGSYDFEERQNIVVRSEDDYAAFWKAMHGRRSPTPARPAVDFSSETVVAVMMGLRPSGGYTIEIKDLTSTSSTIRAEVALTVPGKSCPLPYVLTSPFHIIKVNAVTSEFTFEDTQQTRTCE